MVKVANKQEAFRLVRSACLGFAGIDPAEVYQVVRSSLTKDEFYQIEKVSKFYGMPLLDAVYAIYIASSSLDLGISHDEAKVIISLHKQYNNTLTKEAVNKACGIRMKGWKLGAEWQIQDYVKDVLWGIAESTSLYEDAKHEILPSIHYKHSSLVDDFCDKTAFYHKTVGKLPKTKIKKAKRWFGETIQRLCEYAEGDWWCDYQHIHWIIDDCIMAIEVVEEF